METERWQQRERGREEEEEGQIEHLVPPGGVTGVFSSASPEKAKSFSDLHKVGKTRKKKNRRAWKTLIQTSNWRERGIEAVLSVFSLFFFSFSLRLSSSLLVLLHASVGQLNRNLLPPLSSLLFFFFFFILLWFVFLLFGLFFLALFVFPCRFFLGVLGVFYLSSFSCLDARPVDFSFFSLL